MRMSEEKMKKIEAIKQLESLKRYIIVCDKSNKRTGFLSEDIIALNLAISGLRNSISKRGDF